MYFRNSSHDHSRYPADIRAFRNRLASKHDIEINHGSILGHLGNQNTHVIDAIITLDIFNVAGELTINILKDVQGDMSCFTRKKIPIFYYDVSLSMKVKTA